MDAPVDPWVRITFDQGLEVYEGPVANNQRMVALLCYQDRMPEFGGRLESRYREIAQAIRPGLRQADLVGAVSAVGPFWSRATTVADRGLSCMCLLCTGSTSRRTRSSMLPPPPVATAVASL